MNKVFITGMGAITPLGVDSATTFATALAGRSAIRPAPVKITTWLPQALVASATDPEPLLERKYTGLDRATQFALVAAHEAMNQARLTTSMLSDLDTKRFGVFVGIGFGGIQILEGLYERFYKTLQDPTNHKNPTVVHPLAVPRMMPNAPAALLSMRYGLHGPSNTYSIACASSAVAIGEAFRAIRDGYLDTVLVLGTEAMLTLGSMITWNALRVMAKPDPHDPAYSCRPFALNRSGFVLGEGAAAMVLESGKQLGTRIALAELSGYGCTSDAEHLTAPSMQEQARAMQQALDEAQLTPSQVQYLNAHGTATEVGDVIETQSIHTVFGKSVNQLAVSSTKSMHGHLIGASGILEFMISILAMNSGSLPPTAHLDTPDPRCDLDFIPLIARHHCDIAAVMSNSFAFGGSNVSLIARRLQS